jgi:hypothetical protein
MTTTRSRLLAGTFGAMLLTMLCSCEVTGVGVEGSVGYDGGYYEPYGYDYGGWGGAYRVGPGRGGERRDDHHDDHRGGGRVGHAPAYRPAPAGRSAPSIPGRSAPGRSGGSRSH